MPLVSLELSLFVSDMSLTAFGRSSPNISLSKASIICIELGSHQLSPTIM